MLLVYGPRSVDYDFGPAHPLTPRRFGPGIDLLRALGAEPGLAPEPATDAELRWCHEASYIDVVRRFSYDPFGLPKSGIADYGDNPPFAGMHEAAAAVAGGSLRALEAILGGDVEHAQHPGGGLHHAMADRAAGFCIYDDVALAVARARRDGLRVLYLDVDVHHGDGVQAIHWSDPGVMTVSIHELHWLFFPGTGELDEIGEGSAAGTSVNLPMPAGTRAPVWLAVVRSLFPELTAAFGPDLIVSQHGADSHAWDPLAHLAVTTTAMGEAARLVHDLAHRYAGGRWLATGGGGYDAYRVVPRAWAHVWLAGSHREVPASTPAAWRERWEAEAARHGQAPLPESFDDAALDERLAMDDAPDVTRAAVEVGASVRRALVPRLLREAVDRGWLDLSAPASSAMPVAPLPPPGAATVRARVDAGEWAGLTLAEGVIAPASAADGHALVAAALADGAQVSAAIQRSTVVGLHVARLADRGATRELLALGVAPGWRREGVATALLDAVRETTRPGDVEDIAEVTVAERDVRDPLDVGVRMDVARRLLERAGYEVGPADPAIRRVDPRAIIGRRG